MLRIVFALLCSIIALHAQDIRHINPDGINRSPAYTHVVTAKPGTVIWISGQVAQNSKGEVVGKGDLKAQLNQAWANIKTALAAADATFANVVKITTYVVNYNTSMRNDIREARVRFMGTGEPPASTLVGVQSLASEDFLVEIEVVAVI